LLDSILIPVANFSTDDAYMTTPCYLTPVGSCIKCEDTS